MKKLFLLVCFISILSVYSYAQREKLYQSATIIRWSNAIHLPKGFTINTEFDDRFFMTPVFKQMQYQCRLFVNKKFEKNWYLGLAFAHFGNWVGNPLKESNLVAPEFRWQIEAGNKQKMYDWLSIAHRYRIEHKFKHNTNSSYTELLSGYKNNFRLRYQLGLDFKVWEKEAQIIHISIADEILINAGKAISTNFFDQNRVSTALKYTMNKHFALEAMHIFWLQNSSSGTLYSRQVFRLNSITSFDIKKKEK